VERCISAGRRVRNAGRGNPAQQARTRSFTAWARVFCRSALSEFTISWAAGGLANQVGSSRHVVICEPFHLPELHPNESAGQFESLGSVVGGDAFIR